MELLNQLLALLQRFLAFPIEFIPYVVITLVIAFTVHEFAHAFVAYKFGDETAKRQGRLTLNPLRHLDPIGTLLIFIAGFGWARPVPVNRFFFKRPRLAGVLVSVAGPISNILMVAIGFALWYGIFIRVLPEDLAASTADFLNIFIQINAMLFVFNLLPIPPLDGYRIIEDLVSADLRAKMIGFEKYGVLIFLILVLTPLDQYTIGPIFNTLLPAIVGGMHEFFYQIFTLGG